MFSKTKNSAVKLAVSPNGILYFRLFIAVALLAASLIFPEAALAGPSPGIGNG